MDGAGDRAGESVLQGEDVGGGAFEALAPESGLGIGLDDLGVQAHAVGETGDGAFDDEVDAQLLGDLRQEFLRLLVVHRRLARDDAHAMDAGQRGDQGVGHAVDEVLGLVREVRQRQHDERRELRGDGSGLRSPRAVLGVRVRQAKRPAPSRTIARAATAKRA